ncbi:MAG TPA: 23S rRNA (adenine(2503)-C(2))-methyltransferase RlmN [Abditibacteriaceae bacterium]|jgi:23S rRNA (adenine2503-C2)-methyltransferase
MQLLGQNTTELEALFQEMGEPAFRGRQLAKWIYRRGAASFDDMSDLSRPLRERLASTHSIDFPQVASSYVSRDGSTKLLLQMRDSERIETVHLPYPDRLSVCVSSQAGCAMACQFCATGMGGFRRNLSTDEIIAQPLLAMRHSKYVQEVPTHIVFMGMGEPLLNVNNVLKTIYLMHDEMGIAQRHITVSTVGILNGIKRLAEEKLQVTLAISLHAPTDELRHRLIPTSTKTHVDDIIEAARDYVSHTGRRVTFEYVVLGGVNDSAPLAHKLAKLCKGWPCHVNLIPWNAVPDAALEEVAFSAPEPSTLREFRAILERAGVATTQRVQRGADVAAACGQLRALKENTSTRKADIAFIAPGEKTLA